MTGLSLELLLSSRIALGIRHFVATWDLGCGSFWHCSKIRRRVCEDFPYTQLLILRDAGLLLHLASRGKGGTTDTILQRVEYLNRPVMPHR